MCLKERYQQPSILKDSSSKQDIEVLRLKMLLMVRPFDDNVHQHKVKISLKEKFYPIDKLLLRFFSLM